MELCEVVVQPDLKALGLCQEVATDEATLLAMARESEEGEVLVAPDALIALTKMLYICEKPQDYWDWKNLHCAPRPSGPRAAVVAGAEGRVWAVGAQAWSAPR